MRFFYLRNKKGEKNRVERDFFLNAMKLNIFQAVCNASATLFFSFPHETLFPL
jgi:hypothetical protein